MNPQSIALHCFNCGFSSAYNDGEPLSNSFKTFLNVIGVDRQFVKTIEFEQFKLKNRIVEVREGDARLGAALVSFDIVPAYEARMDISRPSDKADGYRRVSVFVKNNTQRGAFGSVTLNLPAGWEIRKSKPTKEFFDSTGRRKVKGSMDIELAVDAMELAEHVDHIVLFSGESQIKTVSADPAAYGVAVLLAMALVKLALLAVAFKGGFLGGPTFPAIFASTCVALAIGLVFPGLRGDVLIGGVMAGFLMVLFKAPLMVILLTSVMLQATPELIALIVLAVSTVMVVQPTVMAVIARRQAARAGAS